MKTVKSETDTVSQKFPAAKRASISNLQTFHGVKVSGFTVW